MSLPQRRVIKICIASLLVMAVWGLIALRPAPTVPVVRPEIRDVVELVIASGTLRAVRQSEVGTEISGTVAAVKVDEGDIVAVGDVLVTLASDDVVQQLETARRVLATSEAELEQVKRGPQEEEIRKARAEVARAAATRSRTLRDYQRALGLNRQGLLSAADRDAAEAAAREAQASEQAATQALEVLLNQPRSEDVAVAEARVEEARAAIKQIERDLEKRTLRAPLPGLVVRRSVEPGVGVTPGTSLITIADMRHTEIIVETDENNLARLAVGQKALAVSPAYRDMPFEARVSRIGPEIDSARGVVSVRLTPLILPDYARPNMTVDVNIEVARLDKTLAVPLGSVMQEPSGRCYVHLVRDGVILRHDVSLLGKNATHAAIRGLEPDALVVRSGTAVKPGRRVTPSDSVDAHD